MAIGSPLDTTWSCGSCDESFPSRAQLDKHQKHYSCALAYNEPVAAAPPRVLVRVNRSEAAEAVWCRGTETR